MVFFPPKYKQQIAWILAWAELTSQSLSSLEVNKKVLR